MLAGMVTTASLHHIRLFYAAYFAAMGLILPYFPVYVASRGLDVGMVGVFTGLLAMAKVISPPLIGGMLDHRRHADTRIFIIVVSAAAALMAMAFPWAISPAWLAVLTLGFGFLWAAALPLTDGISVTVAEAAFAEYGHLRLWGSVGFVLASLAGGMWLVGAHIHVFPWFLAMLLAITAVSAGGFPRETETLHAGRIDRDALAPAFLLLLGVSFLMQLSHGAYYGLYSLYLLHAGYTGGQVGVLWVLGVLAEIALMWRFSGVIGRMAPVPVLAACLLLAALRWLGIGLTTGWLALAALQLLHAASFAAFHVAAVTWVRRLVPTGRYAAAQGWYSASGFGLGSTIGIMGSGWIAGQWGYSAAFMVCAAVALAGVAVIWRVPWRM
jgi:MFS transporter, PPP family, 3-phenylpropionic acid transporter